MPYIKQNKRDKYDKLVDELANEVKNTCHETCSDYCGDWNYVITTLIKKTIDSNRGYSVFNEAIGTLECCKLELYRRMVAPYEDIKIQENGDV